ncbi:MAG: hypothetical protein DRR19_22270 [Candidatus Parabeggiatoa sp. nov. 1]|nr:MAG: hypothetical protein DRR19_22270 [Gammaproteobacteria bacterium]
MKIIADDLYWVLTSQFINVLTLGEIHKGIAKLPDSEKKTQLETWFHEDVIEQFVKNKSINDEPFENLMNVLRL